MAKPGQKTITLSGKTLKTLEDYYKKELRSNKISFAEFVSAHALKDLERNSSSSTTETYSQSLLKR